MEDLSWRTSHKTFSKTNKENTMKELDLLEEQINRVVISEVVVKPKHKIQVVIFHYLTN